MDGFESTAVVMRWLLWVAAERQDQELFAFTFWRCRRMRNGGLRGVPRHVLLRMKNS
jgi:hypothetical protein